MEALNSKKFKTLEKQN